MLARPSSVRREKYSNPILAARVLPRSLRRFRAAKAPKCWWIELSHALEGSTFWRTHSAGLPVVSQSRTPTMRLFRRMLDLNLNSVFHILRATIPALRQTGNGRIIAIGSRAALEPGAGVGAYSASKAAKVSLIRTVALENKDAGLTANVILPGTMDTPANRKSIPNADFSKWVRPSTVASLITWLVGDAGKDINGAVIPVYGSDV